MSLQGCFQMRRRNNQLVTAEIQTPNFVVYWNDPLIMLRGTALMTVLKKRRFLNRTV